MGGKKAGAHGWAFGGNMRNRKSHRMKVVIVGGTQALTCLLSAAATHRL